MLVHLGNSELPMLPLSAAQRDELHDHVTRDWCKPLAEAGVSISSRPDGWQGRRGALMRAAQIENADLVVTGRRGRGGLTELVLVP